MTDTLSAGQLQSLALFGPPSAPGTAASAPPAPRRPPITLAPVLIGAAVSYGAWRSLRKRRGTRR